jgi:hypothetical protein
MIISYIGKKDRLSLDNELELIYYIFLLALTWVFSHLFKK